MKKEHYGKCALCGKEGKLTFEHVPPRAAFNSYPQKVISGKSAIESINDSRLPWDITGLKYQNQQAGMGAYTLCESCNNLTGTYYGSDYVRFSQGIHSVIQSEKPVPGEVLQINAKFAPLPIIKQVASMFCSLHSFSGKDTSIEKLRLFVLNKDSTIFPKKDFRIGMYIFGGGLERRCPVSVRISGVGGEMKMESVAEIACYPVGYLLYFNPDDDFTMPCADITGFAEQPFGESCNVTFQIPVFECNTMFPGDFRSKCEIEQCIADGNG